MNSMNIKWMESLKKAWLNKDTYEIENIFKNTMFYQEGPFEEKVADVKGIMELWSEIDKQEIIKLEIKELLSNGNELVSNWYLKMKVDNKEYEYDGIYHVVFNADNECIEFRQWWNANE